MAQDLDTKTAIRYLVIIMIVCSLILVVVLRWSARTYSAPPLPEDGFILIDAVQVTGSTTKKMTLVNCVNYPSNTEGVIVSVCSNDPYSTAHEWSQPAETDITGFARTVTIREGGKRRYFAVKCLNEEFQIIPKKVKNKFYEVGELYVFVYAKDANPNQGIIYPYFKHENATIFSQSELPKSCNKGISFSSVKKGVDFTVYAYSSRDIKWTTFATVEFDEEKGCSVEYLTSTHDVTEYDFIAINASDDRSYKYLLSSEKDSLYINVIDYRDDDLN